MRPSAQPFLRKWVLLTWEWKIISISKAEHLTSLWYKGPGELGNVLFNTFCNLHYIYNQLKSVSSFYERNNFTPRLTKQLLNAEQKDSWAYFTNSWQVARESSRHFARDDSTGFLTKCRLKNDCRNSILMTYHYPDLGSASDWLKQISLAARPIRKHYR